MFQVHSCDVQTQLGGQKLLKSFMAARDRFVGAKKSLEGTTCNCSGALHNMPSTAPKYLSLVGIVILLWDAQAKTGLQWLLKTRGLQIEDRLRQGWEGSDRRLQLKKKKKSQFWILNSRLVFWSQNNCALWWAHLEALTVSHCPLGGLHLLP